MRNCFVPGCDQHAKTTPKRPMFLVPKNEEMFQKWMEALPKLRTLKARDKVCHLHFRPEDIVSTYDHNINGVLYQLERGRPRLKQDAVPSENLPSADELKLKLKPSKRLVKKTEKKIFIEYSPTVAQDSITDLIENQDDFIILNDVENNPAETTVTEVLLEDEQEVQTQVDAFFSFYYDSIDQVQLPNTLWAAHRCPERSALFFSYMDAKFMRSTKVVRIASDGTVKIFILSNLFNEFSLLGCAELDEMSEILKQIDAVEISELQIKTEDMISEETPYELIDTE